MNMNMQKKTNDELQEILDETEYCESGVAIGEEAAADQERRRAAQAEIDWRIFGDF